MNVARKILYGIIIFQIAFGSAFYAGNAAYGQGVDETSAAASASQPETLDPVLETRVENDLAELVGASETDLPGASEDVFHLTRQFLEVYSDRAYLKEEKTFKNAGILFNRPERKIEQRKNLMFMALPEVPYANFDTDIAIELNPDHQNLTLSLSDSDGLIAKHVIEGFAPISYARDKEMVTFLDTSGKVFAIDVGYARNRIFSGPLPVFEVADIHMTFNNRDKITSHFVTRGLKPFEAYPKAADGVFPLDKPMTPDYTAGDLVIYSGGSSAGYRGRARERLATLDRNVMQSIMYRNEVFILRLVQPFMRISEAATGVNFSSEKVIDRLSSLVQSEVGTPHQGYSAADPLTRKVFASIGLDSIQPLMAAAETNRAVLTRQRDRFSSTEGWESFKRIHREGVRERAELAKSDEKKNELIGLALTQTLDASARPHDDPIHSDFEENALDLEQAAVLRASAPPVEKGMKGFLHRAITAKALKTLGAITAVGAVGAGVYLGGHALLAGHGAYWAVHIFQKLYTHLWPAVFKDQVYRVTALQTAFWMSWSVPILWGIGALSSKMAGENWSAQKGLAVVTWRVLAVLQYSFLKRIAVLTRQPQFIAALKRNIDPFMQVKANSTVGRQLGLKKDVMPGLNNPLLSHEELAKVSDQNAKILDAVTYQQARGRALAWFLALMTTADAQGLDPVTLAILAQNPASSAEEMEKTTGDANFRSKWVEVAQEYELALKDFASSGVTEDVKSMSAVELKRFKEVVEETAQKIRSRGPLARFATKLKNKWLHVADKAKPFLGNYGEAENKILSKGVPDKFIESSYWNGFWTDFYFTLLQDITVGARAAPADLAKVQQALAQGQAWPNTDLAANGSKFLKTNPDFVAENAGSTIGGPISSATLMLNYSKQTSILEEGYAPVEDRLLSDGEVTDGYWSGMGHWLKGSLNITKANYGILWMRSLFKKVTTLQSTAIIGIGTRMLFGHKTMLNASMGFFYMFFWANWAGSAIWDWVRSGNQIYQNDLAAREASFRQAKTILNQGLRFDDLNGMREGYSLLSKLYETSKVQIPEPVRNAMQSAEQFLKASPKEVMAAQQLVDNALETHSAQQQVVEAIESQDQASVDRAATHLRGLYGDTPGINQEALFKLNAKTLLEFSLKTPPFATKVNNGVNTTSNLIGSPLTTYFVGFVSALTLHSAGGWGPLFAHMLPISIGLYGGTYFGQLLINKYNTQVSEYVKEHYNAIKAKFCGSALNI